jgi:glucose/arabinose dehydrogenase
MKPPKSMVRAALACLPFALVAAACSSASEQSDGAATCGVGVVAGKYCGVVGGDASAPPVDANATSPTFCGRGIDVAGATPPAGFCLKQYAKVVEARTITFAPNGDLFVGAPSTPTPGGSSGGPGAILLLTDANRDGVAETHTFLEQIDAKTSLADVHGIAVGGGALYFTTQASVWRTPYADGQLAASGTPVSLGLATTFGEGGRWTHGLALSVGGTLLASRGAYATCGSGEGGEISSVAADGTLTALASGFRNPMYMRCHRTDDMCAAMELGEDLLMGAREKMLIVRPNTKYGYPCCTTMDAPIEGAMGTLCDDVIKEDASFTLSDTPFGFDWETGAWPAPFTGGIFVALHGSAYSSPPDPVWKGVGIVYAPTNPTTHVPTQDWQLFLGGFSPDGTVLERPSDIAFARDGRMFFSDDTGGHVFWMAPTNLAVPITED